MRGLQITMFILGLLVIGTQTLRHVYVKWIEPTGSVLDAYRDPVEKDISKSNDLDELVGHFEKAQAARKQYEADHPDMEEHERYGNPVFQDEAKLEQAISRVEAQRKSIFDLWFFWLCGLLGVGFGIFAYHRINRWLGMAGMITGFAEMTTWTSALWRTLGPQGEFERLLTTKLILSVVTLALLIVIWLKSERTESVSRPA